MVNEVLSLCHNLVGCGIFGLSAQSARGEQLGRHVWLIIDDEQLRLATRELRFFRSVLEPDDN